MRIIQKETQGRKSCHEFKNSSFDKTELTLYINLIVILHESVYMEKRPHFLLSNLQRGRQIDGPPPSGSALNIRRQSWPITLTDKRSAIYSVL